MQIEYEWDEGKRLSNQAKHGVDFSEIVRFEWDTAVIDASPRHGETRYVAIGYLGGRVYHLVYTIRGDSRRIVSFRRANLRERRHYERER
ncbi:MAG: BrnT family toxin [Chloroflexi bacterium]|nr:BrnT family toxin [Chloroflexota bacterium]